MVHASLPADEELFVWTPEDGFCFREIADLVETEPAARAVSFDPESLAVRTHRITDFIENPAMGIYEITLGSGRQVRVTADHNLFTLDEYGSVTRVRSEDATGELVMVPDSLPGPPGPTEELDLVDLLGENDSIVVYASDGAGDIQGETDDTTTGVGTVRWVDTAAGLVRHYTSRNAAPLDRIRRATIPSDVRIGFKQSNFTLPRTLPVTSELGWVLGFYIAEGYARRKQVVFVNENREYLDRVASFFAPYDTTLSWHQDDNDIWKLTICSALWSAIFRRVAGEGSTKNVPERAWNWSSDVLESMLAGLLDGDGHRRDGRETLYTANESLADRALYLGSRLGLLTSAYRRERSEKTNGEPIVEWAIDFYEDAHKRGQFVPNPSALLREYRHTAGLRQPDVAEAIGRSSKTSISNVENREYDAVRRDTLLDLRNAYADAGVSADRLNRILDGDVRFERVESVRKTDRIEPTYDIEVRPNGRPIENFLGGRGGVFLSNTAGFIDPGFRGRVTLELSNLGTAPVALTPGMRISQLVFTELKTPTRKPYGSERGSKYQDQAGPQASRIQNDDEFAGGGTKG
ncbi:MAG: dCTP deaminase domain-containing protein [Halodesulfurarchaeum sp.]